MHNTDNSVGEVWGGVGAGWGGHRDRNWGTSAILTTIF